MDNDPPARFCAKCGRSHEEAGGHRVEAGQRRHGVLVSMSRTLGAIPDTATTVTVGELVIVFYGPGWTAKARRRATEAVERGEQLWLCQRCIGYVCERCGAPLDRVPSYDVIHDDGSLWHHAILPVPIFCTNPECRKKQTSPPGRFPDWPNDEED